MSGNGLCLAAYGRDVHGEDCISDFMEHKLFHLLPGEGVLREVDRANGPSVAERLFTTGIWAVITV